MDEAERCNHIGLIHQGELLVADSPSAVKMSIGGTVLELRIEDHQKGMRVLDRIKVDIPNPNHELKPGMPADGRILLESPSKP
jgi:ABC-type multidrug transport system ATPase subunit